jgi:hypothetical protein
MKEGNRETHSHTYRERLQKVESKVYLEEKKLETQREREKERLKENVCVF